MNQPHRRALLSRQGSHRFAEAGLHHWQSCWIGPGKEALSPASRPRLGYSEEVAARVVHQLDRRPVFPCVGEGFAHSIRDITGRKTRQQSAAQPRFRCTDELVKGQQNAPCSATPMLTHQGTKRATRKLCTGCSALGDQLNPEPGTQQTG